MFDLRAYTAYACLTFALATDPLLREAQRADAERTMDRRQVPGRPSDYGPTGCLASSSIHYGPYWRGCSTLRRAKM